MPIENKWSENYRGVIDGECSFGPKEARESPRSLVSSTVSSWYGLT
jgi:hypothetical protein